MLRVASGRVRGGLDGQAGPARPGPGPGAWSLAKKEAMNGY